MNRRGFLTALTAMIVVPRFGRFFPEGSGLSLSIPTTTWHTGDVADLRWSAAQNPLTWDDATPPIWGPVRIERHIAPVHFSMEALDRAVKQFYAEPVRLAMQAESHLFTLVTRA